MLAVLLPPALIGFATGETLFGFSLTPQSIVLLAITIGVRNTPFPDDLRGVEAVASFALMFTLVCALAVPPFLVLGMSPLNAIFESVSGVTSTGLSVATATMDWPIVAHLFRAWLQWCGGFAIAFAGIAILTAGSKPSLALGSSGFSARDNLASIRTQAQQLLLAYAALTVCAVLACLLVLPTWWEAVSIGLAAISTGGFSPRADSLGSYSAVAQGIVLFICVIATVSLLFYVQLHRDGLRAALQKSHALATLGLIMGGTVLFVILDYATTGAPAIELYHGALNFISGFTTAGFSTNEVTGHAALIPLVLFAMMIGGDIGSTSGGIKVGRVIVLAQMIRLSVLRVRLPARAVTYLRDGNGRVDPDRITAVAALAALYIVTMLICWTIFLASGAPPLASLFEVTSALSTVGLSQGLTSPDMAAHLQITLIVAMLLGRLEFIALIIVLLPGTWIKRS